MAVLPDLQEISQSKLVRSTIGVISNVRMDHVDEMGPTADDIARSLSRSMPYDGVCVTAEHDRLPVLKQEAARRNCELLVVDPTSVTDEEMAGFGWITFRENVATALAVAQRLGVNRAAALRGMWAAAPDPGVLRIDEYLAAGKRLRFANMFAANDPESTLMNIRELFAGRLITRPLHLVIGCRPDRIERNGQIAALVPRIAPDRVVLIGEPTRSAWAAIPAKWHDRVLDLGGRRDAAELLGGIVAGIDREASVLAVGSIHGQGELLLKQLETLQGVPADVVLRDVAARRRRGAR
jgi:poly-gamma-glutamate synthase PgsB/CapB